MLETHQRFQHDLFGVNGARASAKVAVIPPQWMDIGAHQDICPGSGFGANIQNADHRCTGENAIFNFA
ncbi:hypothetical protein C0J52_00273 [Blattella germanica]|nr:hypothetical protein C0J52_00273 [Blattella germanica]PSN57974.1 hypothetical protein C0J52_00273 [Blattella germanica]